MDRETIAYFTFSFVFALCFILCLRSYLRRRALRRIAVIRIEDEAVDRILRALYSILADGAVVRGLEPAVVNSIPTFPYHSTAAAPEHHHECAVCLSEFEENERLRLLPKCGHFFHSKCVDKWFLSATTCPLCRTVVEAVVLNQDEDPSMAAEPVEEEIAIEPSEPADEEMGLGPVEPDDEEIVELISRSTGRTWRLIFRRRRLGE